MGPLKLPYLVLNMEDSICFSYKNLKKSTLSKCLENYDGFCKLDEESIKELTWGANNLHSSNKIDMPNSKITLHINMLEMKAAWFVIQICAK